LSLESVVKANPDIIITSASRSSWSGWNKLKAVKSNQVYYLSSGIIERTGPRILIGVDKICTMIHTFP
jgi:ABC-type Fe3+-hydroxamate transport system substrate-binding protein